jgi:hypothetical protein
MAATGRPPAENVEDGQAGGGTKPPLERRIARIFGLEGESWMRHANPLSVWTRFSVLPLLAIAIWSRDWIGWLSLFPIGLAIAWMFVNPLLFKEPRSTMSWASRGVFGERIWADRDKVELPRQYRSPMPNVANAYSILGILLLAYGLVTLSVLPVVAGVLITVGGKLWYIDRMVLLFDTMKERRPEYAAWEH